MIIVGWTIGLLGFLAAICSIPWLCGQMIRSMRRQWRDAPAGGSGYNPLLEFVQPRARHVVEVREQRVEQEDEGSPPDPEGRSLPGDSN